MYNIIIITEMIISYNIDYTYLFNYFEMYIYDYYFITLIKMYTHI